MSGLPGEVGSIDACAVEWEKTPSQLKNFCSGDKGVGLLYNVIVTHFKEVIAVEGSYFGTINDKISVKYSEFIDSLRDRKIYKDVSYKVRIGPNDEDFIELSSCYVIADNGYLEQSVFMSGSCSVKILRLDRVG